MRKLVLVLAMVLLVPFGFAACGGDDEEEAPEAVAPTEETTPGAEESDGGAGATGTLEASADPGGQLEFEQDSLQVGAGTVTIDFTNEASVPHDFVIEGPDGNDIGGTDVITSDSTTAQVELDPGSYTFYCSVEGHREAGMEGALTVK